MKASTQQAVEFCDKRTLAPSMKDFNGALNGLQIENDGRISKIGAAVDASLESIERAVEQGVDFLIVHHGLFWRGVQPITGAFKRKLTAALDGNLALFSCHLPLDAHEEIGNNALITQKLGLHTAGRCLEFECVPIGFVGNGVPQRAELRGRLEGLFTRGITAMEFGPEALDRVAICSGSGGSEGIFESLKAQGIHSFVTGELKQHHYAMAQELEMNVYACGHYATETFGVDALGRELAKSLELPYTFIDSDCPL